jgi:hypothetical protein
MSGRFSAGSKVIGAFPTGYPWLSAMNMHRKRRMRRERNKILRVVTQYTHRPITENVHAWLEELAQVLDSILG